MIGSVFAAFAGVLADPVQSRLGIHRRRLGRLLDTLEVEFLWRRHRPFVAREQFYARVLDLWDAAAGALRVFCDARASSLIPTPSVNGSYKFGVLAADGKMVTCEGHIRVANAIANNDADAVRRAMTQMLEQNRRTARRHGIDGEG